ncbi:MAG: Hsp20/alpha crystallin family protein, partial [Pseudomonadota bacterium]
MGDDTQGVVILIAGGVVMRSYRQAGSGGLHEELRDLMGRFVEQEVISGGTPFNFLSRTPVDVSETAHSVVVRLECPGAIPEDFDIHVDGEVLTIKGEKRDLRSTGEETPIRAERWFGSF